MKSCTDCLLINASLECIGGDRIIASGVFHRQLGKRNTHTGFEIAFSYLKSSFFRETESVTKVPQGCKNCPQAGTTSFRET